MKATKKDSDSDSDVNSKIRRGNKSVWSEFARLSKTVTCRLEISLGCFIWPMSVYAFGCKFTNDSISIPAIFGSGLLVLFGVIYCCTINDCADIEADKVNQPSRPLPSGLVTYQEVQSIYIASFIMMIVVGYCLSTSYISLVYLFVHLTCSYLYSASWTNFSGHWIMGYICMIVAYYTMIVFVLRCSPMADADESLENLAIAIAGTAAIHLLLVLPLKDLCDLEGDLAMGRRTLVSILPKSLVIVMAAIGYIVPWLAMILYLQSWDQERYFKIFANLTSACWFSLFEGVIFLTFILVKPELLNIKKFSWAAELASMYTFLMVLCIC